MRFALYMFLSVMLTLPCYTYAEEETNTEEESAAAKPSYFSLDPSIVVNLKSGGRFCRVDIQVMTLNEKALEDIKLHAPAIRHSLILLLSEEKGKELKTPEGQEAFRQAAIATAQKTIEELTGTASVDDIFFTSFFVQ